MNVLALVSAIPRPIALESSVSGATALRGGIVTAKGLRSSVGLTVIRSRLT